MVANLTPQQHLALHAQATARAAVLRREAIRAAWAAIGQALSRAPASVRAG